MKYPDIFTCNNNRSPEAKALRELCESNTPIRIEFDNKNGKVYDGVLTIGSRTIYDCRNEKGVLGNHDEISATFVAINDEMLLIDENSVTFDESGNINIGRVEYNTYAFTSAKAHETSR